MKVVYTANSPKPDFEKATGATYLPLDDLLRTADFISLHVPLTPKTKYLISEREFGIMKKTAILVNTARGPVVDEKALAKALQTGQIWGAGLDVYEREPIVEEALLGLQNAVLAPHLGSATFETRENMGFMAANNILKALGGRCRRSASTQKRRANDSVLRNTLRPPEMVRRPFFYVFVPNLTLSAE